MALADRIRKDPIRALVWIEGAATVLAIGMDVALIASVVLGGFHPDWRIYAASALSTAICIVCVFRVPHAPNRRYLSIGVACAALLIGGWLPPDGILTFVLSAILAARLTFAYVVRGAAIAWIIACAALTLRVFSALDGPDHAVVGGPSSANWMTYVQNVAPSALLLALIFGMLVLMKIYATSSADAAATRERTRIALDLHDFLGHGLTTLGVHLQNVDRFRTSDPNKAEHYLERAISSSNDLLADVRETVGLLHDEETHSALSLTTLIERLCHDFSSAHETRIELRVSVAREPSGRVAVTLYRVVQEALTNVARHASATQIWLTIQDHGDTIEATVEDDGRGLSATASDGHGMISMRERVADVNGAFSIATRENGGTIVHATVPIEATI